MFTHFKTIYNVKDESLAPTPAPAPITEEPAAAPENGITIPSGPAPEPEFFNKGEGYGLYGSDPNQYSQTKETPKTSTFEDELLNEDFNDNKSYKTGYPQTNLYNYHNNEVYSTKNYNTEESKNTYNNEKSKNTYNNEVYSKKYNSEEYKSNYNNDYNKNNVDNYSNNFNNNNNNYYGNGYERKGDQGMSDTRFMENGKYYYNVNGENENYNLNGYESSERGSTENEGYYQKNQYPNEFDTMEEYEKQQEAQGYTP